MSYAELFNFNEIIGYIASIVIIISFTLFDDIKRVRMGNLVGSLLFILYGILIYKIPIIVLNLFVVFIQIYFLFFKKPSLEK
ncbi:MAG: uroporphyrinogen decarboxylase [Solirubrobacteraceae bacterium]